MANEKEATLILKVKDAGSQAIKGVSDIFSRLVITAGDVVNAIKSVVNTGLELAQLGSEIQTVRNAFSNLAASQGQDAQQMLDKMRELSAGTVSDLNLMKNANQALLLGLPVERFGDMLEIARSSARATGQSMDFMLNSIVVGLGRGSKLMLDNLGILVDTNKAYDTYAKELGKTSAALTDAEKKTAFLNEALRIGKENSDAAGGSLLTTGDKIARASANFENMKGAIAEGVTPAMGTLVSAFDRIQASMSSLATSSALTGFFNWTAMRIYDLVLGFELLGAKIGIGLAGAFEVVANAATLNFGKAVDAAKLTMDELNAAHEKAYADRDKVAKEMDAASAAREDGKFAVDMERIKAQNEEKKAAELEAQRVLDEEKAIAAEERRLEDFALETEMMTAEGAAKLELQMRQLDQKIDAEKNFLEKRKLLVEKDRLDDQLREQKLIEWKKSQQEKSDKERIADMKSVFGQISSLQSAHNKGLVMIGKAAALANIYISTSEGIMKAWAMGPYIGPVLAAAVGAAGAVQAANVMGVQLATGGIVSPTAGGTQATIGEGGRHEAVIPLPKDFDPDSGMMGGGSTFNFYGPVMGDESQARQFAKQIDEQLLKLRQRNESVAFDEGTF